MLYCFIFAHTSGMYKNLCRNLNNFEIIKKLSDFSNKDIPL